MSLAFVRISHALQHAGFKVKNTFIDGADSLECASSAQDLCQPLARRAVTAPLPHVQQLENEHPEAWVHDAASGTTGIDTPQTSFSDEFNIVPGDMEMEQPCMLGWATSPSTMSVPFRADVGTVPLPQLRLLEHEEQHGEPDDDSECGISGWADMVQVPSWPQTLFSDDLETDQSFKLGARRSVLQSGVVASSSFCPAEQSSPSSSSSSSTTPADADETAEQWGESEEQLPGGGFATPSAKSVAFWPRTMSEDTLDRFEAMMSRTDDVCQVTQQQQEPSADAPNHRHRSHSDASSASSKIVLLLEHRLSDASTATSLSPSDSISVQRSASLRQVCEPQADASRLESLIRSECAFLKVQGCALVLEAKRSKRTPISGVSQCLRICVLGLPSLKRHKWQRPLAWAVAGVLARVGCPAVIRGGELFASLSAEDDGELVRVDLCAPRDGGEE